jgi:hypothetical protein
MRGYMIKEGEEPPTIRTLIVRNSISWNKEQVKWGKNETCNV